MKYFAYGSNMCVGWLRQPKRAPSARFVTTARLVGHSLRFHKRSDDGSAKADAFATDNATEFVWGVVFEIDDAEKSALDRAEGLGHGYSERRVELISQDGEQLSATMYFADADAIVATHKPYSWYLRFVVDGARQHGLPEDYISRLVEQEVWEDQDRARDARRRAVRC